MEKFTNLVSSGNTNLAALVLCSLYPSPCYNLLRFAFKYVLQVTAIGESGVTARVRQATQLLASEPKFRRTVRFATMWVSPELSSSVGPRQGRSPPPSAPRPAVLTAAASTCAGTGTAWRPAESATAPRTVGMHPMNYIVDDKILRTQKSKEKL